MATGPQPSFNFHARIDRDTEECRRRLQAQTGLSASQLVREAFRELEQRSSVPPQADCRCPERKQLRRFDLRRKREASTA